MERSSEIGAVLQPCRKFAGDEVIGEIKLGEVFKVADYGREKMSLVRKMNLEQIGNFTFV